MGYNEQNQSTYEQAKQDIEKAINTGKSTYKSAKTLGKATSKLATGNVLGATLEVAKDKETAKKVLCIVLIPLIILSMSIVCFLYALPNAIYEETSSYFSEIKAEWESGVYDGTGDILWSGTIETVKAGGKIVKDTIKKIFSLLTGKYKNDGGDAGLSFDSPSDDGFGIFVSQSESIQRRELERKIEATKNKLEARENEIKEAIYKEKRKIEDVVEEKYGSDYDLFYVKLSVNTESITTMSAIELLSLYTVQTSGSLENQQMADYMKWLGWYNSLDSGKTSFNLSDFGITCTVNTYKGNLLPQYLIEQKKQEKYIYGEVKTDTSKNSCPAVDMIITVDFPSIENIPIHKTVKHISETETITIGTAYVNASIMSRSATDLASILGLWGGDLSGDGIVGYGRNMFDSSYMLTGDCRIAKGSLIWAIPSYTRISSPYGMRIHPIYRYKIFHYGIDVPSNLNAPIIASADGIVITSTYKNKRGQYIEIQHENGVSTLYQHLNRRYVRVGDTVTCGDVIGTAGNTGDSTGVHLHYEVKINGKNVDPMKYFE